MTLSFHAARLGEVMETVRHEKPLRVFFDDATHGGYIGTSEVEPIGDEEA